MSVQDHPRKTALAVVLCGSIVVFFMLPRKYGEVSRLTYDISSALYSSCNRQDGSRLEQLEKDIAAGVNEDVISHKEAQWLEDILRLAQHGNWTKARAKARQLMEDQVQYP